MAETDPRRAAGAADRPRHPRGVFAHLDHNVLFERAARERLEPPEARGRSLCRRRLVQYLHDRSGRAPPQVLLALPAICTVFRRAPRMASRKQRRTGARWRGNPRVGGLLWFFLDDCWIFAARATCGFSASLAPRRRLTTLITGPEQRPHRALCRRRRPTLDWRSAQRAAGLLGLLSVKPNWGVFFGLYLIVRGEWRAAATMTATVLILCAIALPLGSALWTGFFHASVSNAAILATYEPFKVITLRGFLEAVLPSIHAARATWAVACILLLWRRGIDLASPRGSYRASRRHVAACRCRQPICFVLRRPCAAGPRDRVVDAEGSLAPWAVADRRRPDCSCLDMGARNLDVGDVARGMGHRATLLFGRPGHGSVVGSVGQ